MLTKEQKEAIVAEVAIVARGAHSAIAAEYRGLTVEQMTKLRQDARNAGAAWSAGARRAGAHGGQPGYSPAAAAHSDARTG